MYTLKVSYGDPMELYELRKEELFEEERQNYSFVRHLAENAIRVDYTRRVKILGDVMSPEGKAAIAAEPELFRSLLTEAIEKMIERARRNHLDVKALRSFLEKEVFPLFEGI